MPIPNLNEYEKEFARGVLSTGYKPNGNGKLYFLAEANRTETPEEAVVSSFCGPLAEAFLSTNNAFRAGKLCAEAQARGEDPFVAIPCDNKN